MKKSLQTITTALLSLATTVATAHPGHGLGSIGHDLQHQLWTFGALVVVGAVCMWGISRNSDSNE
ncbi:MAG: hypothetical protein V4628_01080 [Pseudomonadota bacterium]